MSARGPWPPPSARPPPGPARPPWRRHRRRPPRTRPPGRRVAGGSGSGAPPASPPSGRFAAAQTVAVQRVRLLAVPGRGGRRGLKILITETGPLDDGLPAGIDLGTSEEMVTVRLGFFTACLPRLSLDDIAGWAAANGYDALEVAAWPA